MINHYFATCPKGLELLLVDELKSLGATEAKEKLAGVTFKGDISVAYKACMWSRLANKVLLELAKFPAEDAEQLYRGVHKIDWNKHLNVDATLAVQCVCIDSSINHTMFAAQKVKDAVVDQFRAKFNRRPSVEKDQPDLQIYVYILRDVATVYIDLSGESLHRRGYHLDTGAAPLKENLAAALLIRAKWPEILKLNGSLLDPMCGSATLLLEGAQMALDIAPGLNRKYFGFLGWKQHQKKIWETVVADAIERKENGDRVISITGYDRDPQAIKVAFANIERAGLLGKVHVEKRDVAELVPPPKSIQGLVIVNPPYGERLGQINELEVTYKELGDRLKQNFEGWKAAVFTGNPELCKKMPLHSHKQYSLFNGPIACKLLLFDLQSANFINR